MLIWLDDERPIREGFDLHVRTAEEAIPLLQSGTVTGISFDHDLGTGLTGYHVACEVERLAYEQQLPRPFQVGVHSANPVGRARIFQALHNAARFSEIVFVD